MNLPCRVREQLKNGEIVVAGDQWPLLVYADHEYNAEEPWEGLFQSKLLVWVHFPDFFPASLILHHYFTRRTNIYLPPQALLRKKPKRQGLAMRAYME